MRVSGITRDCFYNCIEIMDQAICEVAALDEPQDMNFLHKHDLENGPAHRIFASRPGTYGNGVNLAVYASAWKADKDLSDVFIYWNGYAYGKGVFGEESQEGLIKQLKSVDVTFNKTTTDEKDLFGCCCYFGNQGGMTAAAREVSGHHVEAYYGDTRDADRVEVRTLSDEVRRVCTKLLNPSGRGDEEHGYKEQGTSPNAWWSTAGGDDKRWMTGYSTLPGPSSWTRRTASSSRRTIPGRWKRWQEAVEAEQRGLWKADPEVLDALKNLYLEIEGWIEERMGDVEGAIQGGSIDVFNAEEVLAWKKRMNKVLGD